MRVSNITYKLSSYLLVLFCLSFTADDTLKTLYTIRSTADFFTTDNFGNTYLVKGDEIKKYNPNGDLLKIYSNKNLGKVTSIDASNSLRLLVFYKDFSSIIILDDLLSQNGDIINLLDLSLEQSDLVCTSFNNGMWFFNRQNASLVRLNDNLQTAVNTGNLNRLLGTDLKPNFILEYDGFVYLNNPSEGILVFDIYGTYSKTINIKGLQHFQVKEQGLVYFDKGIMKSYNLKLLTTVETPFSGVADGRIEKENYFLFYKDSVLVKTADN
ncbi:MAG: hypothetical protein ACXVPN_05975 [Bacteroidia bacterium]